MKKYCPSCGKQNPTSAKFCCHCGDSMTLTSKVKQKSTLSTASHFDDEEDDEEIENIRVTATQLDVEIMPTAFSSKETIGSLMQEGQSNGPATSDGYNKGGGPIKIDEKQFLEDFRREAGPLRGDQTIGEE